MTSGKRMKAARRAARGENEPHVVAVADQMQARGRELAMRCDTSMIPPGDVIEIDVPMGDLIMVDGVTLRHKEIDPVEPYCAWSTEVDPSWHRIPRVLQELIVWTGGSDAWFDPRSNENEARDDRWAAWSVVVVVITVVVAIVAIVVRTGAQFL